MVLLWRPRWEKKVEQVGVQNWWIFFRKRKKLYFDYFAAALPHYFVFMNELSKSISACRVYKYSSAHLGDVSFARPFLGKL